MCRSFIITFHFYPPNGCLKLKCNVELWVRVTILLPHLKRNLINHDLLSHPITVIYSSTFIREIHHVLPCNHLFSIVFKKIICLQSISIKKTISTYEIILHWANSKALVVNINQNVNLRRN